ncbi:MAG: hydroxymethylbilane synthase [Deltaproteobacteria bacterium]|nr:hydroxymethylbilane synthase [Deltaproteobacteria bacterium]
MSNKSKTIRIATRQSPLALWQAEHVGELIRTNDADIDVEYLKLVTKGDKILDQALSKVGGKDLFVKEIEHALIEGAAEVAVHSLKDMPTSLPAALAITAFPPREDPRDALVSTKGYTFEKLPEGARVGTCSLRRAAQLLRLRPDLRIVPIRGNVATRLRKLDEEDMDATILAYAGLVRLEMTEVVTEILSPQVSLPAVGQGILAVETRKDDSATNALVTRFDDAAARAAALAERAFLHALQGGCQVPIAGHAVVTKRSKDAHDDAGDGARTHAPEILSMRGLVASLDGTETIEGEAEGSPHQAAEVGRGLAKVLLAQGAGRILEALKTAAS